MMIPDFASLHLGYDYNRRCLWRATAFGNIGRHQQGGLM